MNSNELGIIRELCKALNVPFLEKQVWPDKEVLSTIKKDAVSWGFCDQETADNLTPNMLLSVVYPNEIVAPQYKVMIDWTEFKGERIGEKWFSEYEAVKTYLEIKFGKYGEIEYAKL